MQRDELQPVALGPGWVTALAAPPGAVALTSRLTRRWGVVRLGAGAFHDQAQLEGAVARAADDLRRLPVLTDGPPAAGGEACTSLFVHLTESCNLRCRHCYDQGHHAPSARRLGTGALIDAARSLVPLGLGRVTLSGGEPLLVPELPELIEALRALGVTVQLLTNATLLADALARRLAAAQVEVTVSLHGADAESHDRLAGQGAYHRVLRGLGRLRAHVPPDRFTINTTLTDWNLTQVDAVVERAARLGAGTVRFMPLHHPARLGAGAPALGVTAPALLDVFRQAARRLVGRRWPVHVNVGLTGLPCPAPCDQATGERVCNVGRKLVVTARGEIHPCVLLMGPRWQLGSLDEGIVASFRSGRLRQLRERVRCRALAIARCSRCPWSGICQAGCPGLAWQHHGTLRRPDPLCAANRAFTREYLSSLADAALARQGVP